MFGSEAKVQTARIAQNLKLVQPISARALVRVGMFLLGLYSIGRAQELQPRAYLPAPIGVGFGGIAYGPLAGGLLFDPSLPITDGHVNAQIWTASAGGVFGTLGRTSQVLAILPYVVADLTGNVAGTGASRHKSGLADSVFRYSVNLIGAPAMRRKEFASYRQKNILGISLTVQAPTGQYDPKVLINLGANRWAFKPEVGVSTAHGRWVYEGAFGVWLYSRNSKFPGGFLRTQSPLLSTQAHLVRLVRQRHWIAFDTSYFAGAIGRVDGIKKSTNQSSLRVGLTYGLIFSGRQSVRFSYFDTTLARLGGNTQSLGVAYQFLWATGR